MLTRERHDVARLIRHQGVARMVESVLELREDGIDCAGRIPPGHALARGGRAPAFVGLELAAQAAAVFEALRRPEQEPGSGARMGLLVSLRDVRLELSDLPAGVPLVASVRSLGGAAALSLYAVRVLHDGRLCVEGTLGTFAPGATAQRRRGAQ
jgi:predicted hotdog family 3-hydroxylacyl-ACP dehydratase